MRFLDRKQVYLVLTVLWAGVIFIGSSIPGSTLPSAPDNVSVVVHITEYLIFGLLLMQVFWAYYGCFKLVDTFVIGILYGLSDELHQYFVPGRFVDPMDMAYNVIGLLFGVMIFVVFHVKKHPRKKSNI